MYRIGIVMQFYFANIVSRGSVRMIKIAVAK
jgi:hypothetical protein